jgi:aspartyl-tRNA(Asn)/glutamyl-tRNA(Gln) amidotransferase subunit A
MMGGINMQLFEKTAHELHELLVKKEISSVELTTNIFERIESVEPKVGAYITLTKDKAMAKAQEVDAKIARGEELTPLSGIPMGLKDNISTLGVRTTCSSKMLLNYVPPYDATVVEKLDTAGAVMLGKQNMDEFAMGSSTETSYFDPTKNPWDLSTVPGGSSGGPAAAVAAGEAIFALGSDTGGSIRQPASFCGVVGLKPTYGMVSRYGLLAYASSLDQIGTFTKDVTDCALVLQEIAGYDSKDSTSLLQEIPNYLESLHKGIKGLRIGIPKEYFAAELNQDLEQSVKKAISIYEDLGAIIKEVSLPHTMYALPVYYVIGPAECSSNFARFDGVRYGYRNKDAEDVLNMFVQTRSEGFGSEVKRRILLGTHVLSSGQYDAYYRKALKVRTLIKQDFDMAFEECDVLLTPTTVSPAFNFGEKSADPLDMYKNDSCTVAANIAGLPAITLPCGFSQGLPLGLQLIAKPLAESTILSAAYAFEKSTDYHRQRPQLGGK